MTDARLERLTEMARKAWPHFKDVRALLNQHHDEIPKATVVFDSVHLDGDVVIAEIQHPRALEAAEAALTLLAGERESFVPAHRYMDAIARAEKAEARLSQATAVLEVFANASPDATCGSLTAVTDSCSYWAQALAQKLVKP